MNITIIGAGKLGVMLAKTLMAENHDITIIDINEDRVGKLVEMLDVQGISGSATHYDVLDEADMKNCDLLICTTPSDENNILSCLIARKMGAKHTIARVRNPEYSSQMNFMRDELGISMMINPDFAAALEIFRILQFPSASTVESFSHGRINMAGLKVSESSMLANKKISEIPDKYINSFIICAVCRGDDVFIPNGNFIILPGDILHITGSHHDLGKIVKELISKKSTNVKSVMLIGGSRISVYLANMLTASGKDVVVIEKNKNNCDKLYEHCPKATVINGDASDYSLLAEEGIDKVDAVVTLTDTDEVNFLVSMYSESIGVTKNITKINNQNLSRMLTKMGMDSYVNISEITSDIITQYVRARSSVSSSNMKTLYKLVDGKIEAIEFVAGEDIKFLNKPISSLRIKKDILIAAIQRKNKTIFPTGSDVIKEHDRVIIISKDTKIYSLNDILS